MNLNGRLSAAVESDIVGYTTVSMEADKWYLLGCPFVALDGATTYKVNEVFGGTAFATGDVLYLLQENGTFTPHYWNTANSGWSTHRVLWKENTTDYPISTAVYLNKKTSGSITFAGKVASTELEVGAEDGNAWSLTSFVYPEERTLDDYAWGAFESGDLLYTMNAEGVFTPHYWNASTQGWSLHRVLSKPDTTPLMVGQAVYLLKKSAGKGTITLK